MSHTSLKGPSSDRQALKENPKSENLKVLLMYTVTSGRPLPSFGLSLPHPSNAHPHEHGEMGKEWRTVRDEEGQGSGMIESGAGAGKGLQVGRGDGR